VAIRFPSGISPHHSTAVYDTPFAAIARKAYMEVPEELPAAFKPLAADSDYNSAKGDWPALNWVRLTDYRSALTVANTGTPGHQLTANCITVSLLRSGTKTEDGGITPPPGAMDNGEHHYQFAFCAHAPTDTAVSYRIGNLLNRKPVALPGKLPEKSLLEWNSDYFNLSCLRKNAAGKLIARFYENSGSSATLQLAGDAVAGKTLRSANAYGEALEISGDEMLFKPMEIKTFIL
jgi:alpha-mannosidase